LGIFSLYESITECRDKWKIHLQRMEQIFIQHQASTNRPSGGKDIERPRRGWKDVTILEAETCDSPNP
jgi:hypothetical protein